NVLYVPRASNNLISISKLDREGGGAQMKDSSVTLHIRGGQTIVKGKLINRLYKLDTRTQLYPKTCVQTVQENLEKYWLLWH
ncbi:hypothetical protein DEU56DRAFT_703482, partial [Suillus clintonianus]|uniref:uncharacterized protein n=1 Tax=Suillus clintonianus TaxID=1904413 RepID=UPI001B866241